MTSVTLKIFVNWSSFTTVNVKILRVRQPRDLGSMILSSLSFSRQVVCIIMEMLMEITHQNLRAARVGFFMFISLGLAESDS